MQPAGYIGHNEHTGQENASTTGLKPFLSYVVDAPSQG